MKKELCVLIVDDEPMILDAYKKAFNLIKSKEFKFVIHLAKNCETAHSKIIDASLNRNYDLILLDISLPPSLDENILCGEDLGVKIKELMPNCKTIISTSYSDAYRLHGILNSVNPDGLLVKSDVTLLEVVNAIKKVMHKPPYYSQTILDLLRKQISADYALDKTDRQLLYELSIGTKMKELPSILPMSLTTIEKRKHFFKEIFNVQKKSDRDLVLVAKEKGFI
ncbi:MAG: response regulator [Flavobacteriaceae bacterium]|nr:MAG: response regulator [Flavobacteriaceae bacterium]